MLDLAVWDADGAGPGRPLLVISGGFNVQAGDGMAGGIATWDGAALGRLGSGFGGGREVRAVATWDPDGPGPAGQMLFAGGNINASGGVPMHGVARWDGAAWTATGLPSGSVCEALAMWDPDGAGPREAVLLGAGSLGQQLLMVYEGDAWRPFETPLTTAINPRIMTFDHDSDPSTPSRVIVWGLSIRAGAVVGSVLQWDGASWTVPGAEVLGGRVHAVIEVPPASWADAGPSLLCVGEFSDAENTVARSAVLRAGHWRALGDGLNTAPNSLATFDADGAGPGGEVLVAGGGFTRIGRDAGPYLATYDGSGWSNGLGVSTWEVGAMTVWDEDGAGSGAGALVATVYRRASDPPVREYVAKLTSGGWTFLAGGLDSYHQGRNYFALGVDHQNRLALGGDITNLPIVNAARWSGSAWTAMGGQFSENVLCFTLADLDGAGPQPKLLIAAGTRDLSDSNWISAWNGTAWVRLGAGFNGTAASLTYGDPDGEGPLPASLLVAGAIQFSHDATIRGIARFDGTSWRQLGTADLYPAGVDAIAFWDPDGPGPMPKQLVAGGRMRDAAGVSVKGIGRWDGERWHGFGAGLRGGPQINDLTQASILTLWDADGPGPLPERLVVGGRFGRAGGLPSGGIAWLEPAFCCPADFNADGFLDFFDYLDFVSCFEGQGCASPDPLAADFNADGFVDFFDYGDFVDAFAAGC